MRIVSDFKDYYDCIQKIAQDRSYTWVRKQKEITAKWFDTGYRIWTFETRIIGFCGKLYPCAKYYYGGDKDETTGVIDRTKSKTFYCFDSLMTGYQKDAPKQYKDLDKRSKEKDFWLRSYTITHLKTFFKKSDEIASSKDWTYLFVDNKTPCFVYNPDHRFNNNIILNGSLKEWEFYRIFEPNTAFQELTMYLGSALCLNSETTPKYKGMKLNNDISDKDMRDIKGFDDKSFKTPKGKKKRRKI